MMKMILASALVLSTPAMANSLELSELCGTLRVQRVFCVTAPCYPLFTIEGDADAFSVSVENNDELADALSRLNGKNVCLYGLPGEEDFFTAFGISKKNR